MSEKMTISYTNGTAALQIPGRIEQTGGAKIIAFPGERAERGASRANRANGTACADQANRSGASNEARVARKRGSHATAPQRHRSLREAARGILLASEMYCSLRYESMLGCSYHLFTKEGVAALSTGAAFIGIVSLILGS